MEDGLSRNEALVEDGHGIREDIVQDDIDRLIGFKQDFIDLMKSVQRHVGKESFAEYAVAIEQSFDDMLHGQFTRLNNSIDACMCLPESYELHVYNAESRRRLA